MKIAIVHDYIKEYGGAERVLEALHEIWPDAPIFTTVYLPEFLGPHKARFENWDIRTSFLQYIPFKEKLISPFRLLTPFIFKIFDLSNYDAVIVSATGSYVKQFKIKNLKLKIIEYCHTPPRYLYGYATARDWKKNLIFKVFGEIANHFLRLIDFKSAQNVDFFIANSNEVKGRIEKFYRRKSTVIYPPVDVNFQKTQNTQYFRASDNLTIRSSDSPMHRFTEFSEYSGKYYLAGGRIARPKHIDLIIQTFEKLDLPLVVFGREFAGSNQIKNHPFGRLRTKIKNIDQNSKVEFLGEVSDYEKMELMRNAKAYIFASEDEDFGITPVEAQSVGTPVIAYKSGGVVESVAEGKTGIFYRFNDLNHLSKAISKFEKTKFNKEFIIKHAQRFSKDRFKKEIREFVESKIRS